MEEKMCQNHYEKREIKMEGCFIYTHEIILYNVREKGINI